jgi:hypothetical protein
MKTFFDYLNEKRKNPDQNPKIDLITALEPYKNDPNIYISYTAIDKIGINPKSRFNTPIGIYTYPLKEVWSDIEKDRIKFQGDKPAEFVWVVRSKNVIKDLSDYSESDYKKDIEKLRKHTTNLELLNTFIDYGEKNSKIKTASGKFWNVTRIVSHNNAIAKDYVKGSRPMTRWGHLLRWLGYEGFSDKKGWGLIHPNEPTQAVFFSTSAFKVVTKTLNKRYYGLNYKSWDGGVWNDYLWSGGVWNKGIWQEGTWQEGQWKTGTWHDGVWENGTWYSGKWFKGVWINGTWLDGDWRNGTWYGGTWRNGEWENGTWEKGTWFNGTWWDGTWRNGTWKNGKWYDGTWLNGTWEDGKWEDGTWLGGTWVKGKIKVHKFKKFIETKLNPSDIKSLEKPSKNFKEFEEAVRLVERTLKK